MLTDKQLSKIKSEMEQGSPIPKTLKEQNIEIKAMEVRDQLFGKYGKEEIQKIIREKIRPNMPGMGAGMGRQFTLMTERLLSRPNIKAEQIDSMIASLQDCIVKLNAKKAELK